METIQCTVKTAGGKDKGQVALDATIFGIKPNKNLVYEAVRWQLNRRRAGTHSTLTRSEMNATGKKPYKQKGTGRARAGSSVSPLWVGGAIVFGPKPRDYDFRLSKRSRRTAICSVLSAKVAAGKLLVVDSLDIEGGKTKNMVSLLSSLGLTDTKVLMVVAGEKGTAELSSAWKSSRNIKKIKPIRVDGVNVYDVLNAETVLTTEAGIQALIERFKE